MELNSPAFQENERIPRRCSAEGENLSPPLEIEGIPAGTKSLALIVEDSDAPGGSFVHWLVWNLSPQTTLIEEGAGVEGGRRLGGAVQGKNDFDRVRYDGPIPPRNEEHHYQFHLYALNRKLSLPPGSSREELEEAMARHTLEHLTLTGRYRRGQLEEELGAEP